MLQLKPVEKLYPGGALPATGAGAVEVEPESSNAGCHAEDTM